VVVAAAIPGDVKWPIVTAAGFGEFEHVSGLPGLDLPGIDICSIAGGYGIAAHRVGEPEELCKAVHADIDSGAPT
jgi:benzoylformate decarboxylase